MHSLDKVMKLFKHLEKKESNSLAKSYFGWIVKGLLIENEYKEECEKCGKVLYHHFKYWLPVSFDSSQSTIDEFFLYIYNVYSPIRNTIETLDSVESIRLSGKW